ncbi:recombinase family protein [Frankia sp. CcI49]|uniref:recombinase family protein n=1 Tax=Frankia sp. CcI49 TaxID=1745382 RepID=UPI000977B7DC|nr:recombinase family protein [Frankia sp. CcI49]ONH54614.1 recombinase family protein [Frankia sp. CcI49]
MPRSTARRVTSPRTRDAFASTLPATVRVGIYLRRSTDDDHQRYTLDAQEDRLRSYVDSQPGWEITLRFSDDASGASTDRKDLHRALAAARAGLIDVLLVYRVDRLSRNLRDTVQLLEDLDEAGVVFRSATEPFDTSTPMGRMLLQMLAMFAQFERDTIIDRVVAGMERKAREGRWMSTQAPYGYHVDKPTWTLIPHEPEAAIIRAIFELYTRRRLGARAIATTLNDRGHRTRSGNQWTGHQVLRYLDNRVYLGESSFRDIVVVDTHQPIIDRAIFDEAQRLLTARSEAHSRRASNASDYHLTGRMRCPRCGKTMLGTRATGRQGRKYRYYTCFTRNRYGSDRCDAPRLDADAIDHAVLEALADFYRRQHTLIADAIKRAQQAHRNARGDLRAELTTVDTELTQTNRAIDRYLTAFEHGTIDEETIGERLAKLRTQQKQLRQRHTELTDQIAREPVTPAPTDLDAIAVNITIVIKTGTNQQRKALIEALIAEVKISGPDRLIPVFRIPQPDPDDDQPPTLTAVAAHPPATTAPKGTVRAMNTRVRSEGLEPPTF